MKKLLITATLATGLLTGASAYATGFQFSVLDNNFPEASETNGVRIALLYGKTDTVKGFNTAVFGLSELELCMVLRLISLVLILSIKKLVGIQLVLLTFIMVSRMVSQVVL